uniref:Uncharacterized protein n=1 Tax=Nonomuraea gerenzanensis TaxID=93944 RepID=A0A1M4EEA3_9ACTN|nr:hypothetical protein BN4615_P6656 [Nonomuraea gerenzanensis]
MSVKTDEEQRRAAESGFARMQEALATVVTTTFDGRMSDG